MSADCTGQLAERHLTPLYSGDEDHADEVELGDSETNSTNTTVSEDSQEDENDFNCESDDNHELVKQETTTYKRLRNLPSRETKRNNRSLRISMKPPRVSAKSTVKLTPSEIKKLYTTQKLTRFQPAKLETIFEEPQPISSRISKKPADNADTQFCFIGRTKVRRSLKCSDGFNTNKTLLKQRRAKIKKVFGRRHTWKKMPLQSFIEHMQKSLNPLDETDGDESNVLQQPIVPNDAPLPNGITAEVVEEQTMGVVLEK